MNRLAGAAALVAVGFFLGQARSQDGDSKDEKLRLMIKVSGEARDAAKICREQIEANKTLAPEFKKRFAAASSEKAFEDLFLPIYSKYFDEDDADALVAFYRSPTGKKLAKKRYQIQKDAMEAGREWGFKTGMKIQQDLQKGDDDDDDDAPKKKEEPKKEEPKKEEPKKKPAPKDEDF